MEQTRRAHSIMCHHFHNRGIHIPSQGSIDFNEFDALIQYYKKQGYSLIDAEEWMEKAISTSLRPNEVCISFDDGLKCQFDIAAEVLEKNDLTAFFFVPSQRFIGERENLELFRHFRFSQFADIDQFYHSFFRILEQSTIYKQKKWKSLLSKFKPEEYLSEFSFYTPADRKFRYIRDDLMTEQEYYDFMFEMMERFHYNVEEAEKNLYMNHAEITELHRKGHILGLHSHTHYTNLANVSKERQFWEFQTNQRILEEIIGKKIRVASYPCNSYNKESLQIMRELGVALAFRANMEEGFTSVLELPREDHSNIIRRMKDENYGVYQ